MQKNSLNLVVATLLTASLATSMSTANANAVNNMQKISAANITNYLRTQAQPVLDIQQAQIEAQKIYQTMAGEFSIVATDYAQAHSYLLEAAKLSNSDALFERAILAAQQNKDFEAALTIAQAWQTSNPTTQNAHRYTLDALVKLRKFDQLVPTIQNVLNTTEEAEQAEMIALIGQFLSPNARVVESYYQEALQPWIDGGNPTVAAAAWLSLASVHRQARNSEAAIASLYSAHQVSPESAGPILLAIEMIDNQTPKAEGLVLQYLEQPTADTKIRLLYVQSLLEAQRIEEAYQQLKTAVAQPDAPSITWFLLGSLQMELKQYSSGSKSLKTYLNAVKNDTSAEAQSNKERALLELAQAEVELGNLKAAGSWLDQINAPQIKEPALLAYINMLTQAGMFDLALSTIKKLPDVTQQARTQKALLHAQTLVHAKRWRRAYNYLEQINAKEIIPSPNLLYLQAITATELKNHKQAEAILRKLIQIDPEHAHALNALGYSLTLQNKNLEEAKTHIEKALSLEPNSGAILDSLGWVEFKLGNTQAAIKHLSQAYSIYPEAEVAAHYGEVLWVSGQRERALVVWRLGLETKPKSSDITETIKRLGVSKNQVMRADTLHAQNQVESAPNTAATSLTESRRTIANRIALFYEQGRWQELYELLDTQSATQGSHLLLQIQAHAADELGNYKDAERLYRRAIQLNPKDGMYYNNLGYMLLINTNRSDEARDLIRKANELLPNDPYILDSLGWAEFQMGNAEEALTYLRQAYELRPNLAEIGIHKGEILWHLNQKAEALLIWIDVQHQHTDDAEAMALLAETLNRLSVTLP